MEQLTKDQAIAFAKNKCYEAWDYREIAEFQISQKKMCMPFGIFHEAVEKTLGRPVFTHEFGLNYDGIKEEIFGDKCTPTLDEIIDLIPEAKRIILA